MDRRIKSARVLIVDDESDNVRVLQQALESGGYARVQGTTDPREARELYVKFRPDIILLDLHMPFLDGFEVMEQLSELAETTYLPIVVLTGDLAPEAKQRALSMGAKDFVNKPFDASEVLLRIKTLLETRFLYLQIQAQNHLLEVKVQERTRALEEAQVEIIERLAVAAEFRDDSTGQHTRRVGQTSALVAQQLGWSDTQVNLMRRAAPLHDIGKIGIPDYILLKMGKLTTEEFTVIKTHTAIGARILSGSHFPLLQLAEQIALTHHERWDGDGYTHGVRGDDIPLSGRIVAVADVFDALTQQRPYKPAWPLEQAIAEVDRQRGWQFDPGVAEAFLRIMERNRPEPATSIEA